ncbi:hypothetical protein [Clostridium sp.]|uniref:hypothetical protein n=1 Tax=Clostridium sp. TaxID=1506 RepID=UPI00321782CD
MGWTSYHAEFYKRNGQIDRKNEMNKIFTQEEHDGADYQGGTCHYPQYRVLKSVMVSSVYYAAIEITNSIKNTREVFGAVALTSTNLKDYYNFSYKDMDDTMEPYYYDCSKGILDLLTPTNNKNANIWREKCRNKLKLKMEKKTINTLPVGSKIKFKRNNGELIELIKHEPAYQYSRPFWFDGTYHWQTKHIPDNFEIIRVGV